MPVATNRGGQYVTIQIASLARTGSPHYRYVTFTARELEVAEEHGADTTDRGRMFYEYKAEILQSSRPLGTYSQGCPSCGKVALDQF